MSKNISASVLARLLNLAKQRNDDYTLLLNRFALERLLARVSTSAYSDRFCSKALYCLHFGTTNLTVQPAMRICSALDQTMQRR